MTDVPSTSASVPIATEQPDTIRAENKSRKPIRNDDKEPFVLPPKRPRYKTENARLAKAASSNKQFTTYRRIAQANHLSKKVSVITMTGKYPVVPQHLPYNSAVAPQHLPYNSPVLPQHLSFNSPSAPLSNSVLFPVKRLCPRKMDSFEDEAQTELVETIKQKILNDTARRQAEANGARSRIERTTSSTNSNHVNINNTNTNTNNITNNLSTESSTSSSNIPSFAIATNLSNNTPTTSTVCEHNDNKTGLKCKQRAILCYRYCIRHILWDPRAPYTQCEHLCRPRNKKSEVSRCTNAVRNDSGEVLCSTHLIMYGMKNVRKKKMQYTDYYYEDYYNSPNSNGEYMYLTSARSPSPNSPNQASTGKMMKTTLSEPPLPPIQIPQLPQLGQTDFTDSTYETKRPVYNFVPAYNNQEFVPISSKSIIRKPPLPEREKSPIFIISDKLSKSMIPQISCDTNGRSDDPKSLVEPPTTNSIQVTRALNGSDVTKSKTTTASTIDTIIEEVRLAARRSVQARAELAESKNLSKLTPSPRKITKRILKKTPNDDDVIDIIAPGSVNYQSTAVPDNIVRESFDVNIVNSSDAVYIQPKEKYSAKINSSTSQQQRQLLLSPLQQHKQQQHQKQLHHQHQHQQQGQPQQPQHPRSQPQLHPNANSQHQHQRRQQHLQLQQHQLQQRHSQHQQKSENQQLQQQKPKLQQQVQHQQKPKEETDGYSATLKRKLIQEERALRKKLKKTPDVFNKMEKILKEMSIGPTFSTDDSVGADVKEGKNLREIVRNLQSKTMRTNLTELEALQNEDENMCYSPFNWFAHEDFKEELLEADDDSFTFVNFCSGYWDEQTFWEKSRKVRNREISQYSYEKLAGLLVRVNALSDHMKNSDISQRVQNRFSCTTPDSRDGIDVDYDDLKKCHHVENNIRCNKSCLPYANHCSNHVLYSVSQRLFSFCTHTCCRRPVVSVDVIVWDGKCRLHRASLYDKYDSDGELIVKEIESSNVPLNELYGKGKYDTVPCVTRKCETSVIGQAIPVMPISREPPVVPKMNDNFLHTLNTTTPDIGGNNSFDNMKDDTLYEGDGEVGDLLKFIDGENEDLDSFSLEIEQ
ncbi:unnamed protein product [Auanema sp. JU1783]|nr:unnamed protein product [Auanema sp. JU1783]